MGIYRDLLFDLTSIQESSTKITYSNSFNDVKNIVNSLTDKELHEICTGTFKNSPYVVYRQVLKVNNNPAAFIDVYSIPQEMEKDEAVIIIACKKKYRGEGYTDILVENAIIVLKDNNQIKKLYWEASPKNIFSLKMAERNGFNNPYQINDDTIQYMMNLDESYIEERVDETLNIDPEIIKFNKELNSWKYGILINGKVYTKSDKIDWSKYKTIPTELMAKYHVGVCWDFVNYEYKWFKEKGIKTEAFMFVMQLSDDVDDIVTHTFLLFNEKGSKYWFESSWFGHQHIVKVSGYKDVIKELVDRYGNHPYSVYKYSPEGLDKNLTNGEFFKRTTKNLVFNYEVKNESYIEEAMLFNEKDIYYNKDKFDKGDINLCFIIGHSGSGKSTMSKNMSKDNIEHYELDDLQCIKDNFTMEQLKEYGDLIYSYFNGPGKKFYITYKELVDNKIPGSEYEDKLFPEFVHYAMKYANSHKNKKFIIEGVWLFCNDEKKQPYFTPEEFKDYAFYIKGTSMIISKHRAAVRDSKDAKNRLEQIKSYAKDFFTKNWKWYFLDEKRINRFRNYFKSQSTNESYMEESNYVKYKSNFKKKSVNFKYKAYNINSNEAKPFIESNSYTKKYLDYLSENTGEILVDTDNNNLIGYIFVGKTKDKGFISTLEVLKRYRGYGFGNILLKDGINKFHAIDLVVFKDNEVAIDMYKKFGFVIIGEAKNGKAWWMKLKSKLSKNDKIINEFYIEETNDDILFKIIEFNKKLNNYEYIIPNNGNIITRIKGDDFLKYYKLLSPTEFEKYHGGVCWDYVQYEADYFRKHFSGVKFKTYYHIIDDQNMCPTHTFLLFNLDNKWYWFESSWKSKVGIRGYNNERDALASISYQLREYTELDNQYKSYITEYNTSSLKAGMTCEEYMNYFSSKVKPISGKDIKPSYYSKGEVIEEACKDLKTARKFVTDVQRIAKKYNANFFLVTDGASGYSNGNGGSNPAVKNARNKQIQWEKENGFDPDEDWSKDTLYRVTYYNNEGIYEAFKQNATYKDWNKFLNSKAAKWLKHPPIDYKPGYISYFTTSGYNKFCMYTLPTILKAIDKKDINIEQYKSQEVLNMYNIVYQDEYQIVVDTNKSIHESPDYSELDKSFKVKKGYTFKMLDVDSREASKYFDNKFANGKSGEVAICNETDEVAGFIYVTKTKKIGPLEVYKKYRGYRLSEKLLEDAIKKYGGNSIGVYSDNAIAYRLYKKFGFKKVGEKKYKDGDVAIIMELK